jgi:hypothetical protein
MRSLQVLVAALQMMQEARGSDHTMTYASVAAGCHHLAHLPREACIHGYVTWCARGNHEAAGHIGSAPALPAIMATSASPGLVALQPQEGDMRH